MIRDPGYKGSGEHSGHRCGRKCSQGDEEHSVFESNGEHSQAMVWWGALAGHRDIEEAF